MNQDRTEISINRITEIKGVADSGVTLRGNKKGAIAAIIAGDS